MSGYKLVQEASLVSVADAIRTVAGLDQSVKLDFPEDFVIEILGLQQASEEPTTESLTLSFVTGDPVYDSSSVEYSNYVCVGHSSNYIKNDAVWSFTPSINATKAVFTFSWDNTIGSVGWQGAYVYRFQVGTNSAVGELIDSGATEVPLSGKSGTATVTITGLNLVAGTTYYIRANHEDYTTNQTLKAFVKAGNSVILSI